MSVLVLERRPYWTVELRRELADEELPVRSCGTTADVADAVARSATPCVVLFDLTDAARECLEWLGARRAGSRPDPVVCYAGGRTGELEWVVRELGAAAVLHEPTTPREMAAVCRRVRSNLTST